MSKSYSDLLEEAAKVNESKFVFTIPRGFEEKDLDEESLKQLRIKRQFDKLVMQVELAAHD